MHDSMRLERHVGGLSMERKTKYLREAGWREEGSLWRSSQVDAEACALSRALHHQLTADLSAALATRGWKVGGYSQRGYVKLVDPKDESSCSLPGALRRQARRDGCPVRELTYGLFLNAMLMRA
jgi:hypothetical protein